MYDALPVAAGYPASDYRLCSQNEAMNRQPVIVPIAQHGNLDDCVYVSPSSVVNSCAK
jgi:hypothetical protein